MGDGSDADLLVTTKVIGTIGIIELTQPTRRNVLSLQMQQAVTAALAAWHQVDEVRAVILQGRGPVFCAGGDLSEFPADMAAAEDLLQRAMRWFLSIEHYPKPIIGAINGPAIGGGFELALACDLLVASREATFQLPELGLGIAPVYAFAALGGVLPRNVVHEMIFAARRIDAREALRLGLVSSVADPDELAADALALANAIVRPTGRAAAVAKGLLRTDTRPSTRAIARAVATLFATPEARDRIGAVRAGLRHHEQARARADGDA